MKTGTWTHSERPRRAASERQTIGLVVDSVADGYQRILFESIARATRDQGVNLIVFAGGPLPSPLYDLIDRRNVDAVIVVGSTIAHQVGPERLAAFCKRLPSVPVCSIGVPVDSIPSLVPVATPGVIAVVTHLMTEHGRRRLAFIRGLGADGAERFEAFRTCLNEFGVPFREELVVDGTYVMESGREAIRILCDERRVSFDGVVAANDYMALGAIEALEERGFTVPKDVAVVGFDDIEDARNALVPLTTVQQPIRELGKRAVLVCLKLLAQRPLGEVGPITCRPVKRRSCGCVVETPYTRRPSDLAQHFSSTEAALMARRELVLSDMLRTAQEELGDVGYHWEERLFNAIVEELQSGAGSPFLSANEELSRRVFRSSGDVSTWQRVLLALRFHVLECIEDDHALRSAAEDAFNNAFLVSASVVAREEHSRRSGLEQLLRGVIRTSNALVTCSDAQEIAPVLVRHLDAVGLGSCYLSLYEDESRDRSNLVLGYDRNLPMRRVEVPRLFPTRELVPSDLLPTARSTVYVLVPLTGGANRLGFGLFEYEHQDTIFFEILQAQIGGALQAVAE